MKKKRRFSLNVSHLTFSLWFTMALFVVCNAINYDKIVKWFYLGEQVDYAGFLAFLILGWSLFVAFFLLLAHRWSIKPLAILFIVLSAGVTYFISKYNVAIDRTMVMNAFYTDSTEVSGLLTAQMIPYVLFLVIGPVFLISRVRITFHRPLRHLATSALAIVVVLGVGIGMAYANYNSIHRAANVSDKYVIHSLVPLNLIRSIASVVHRSVQKYQHDNRREIQINGKVTAQQDLVVVLTIGESARQKSFNLYGYDRRITNPELSRDDSLHILNGKASIGTTLFALLEILEKDDIKLPAITSALGIDTTCYVNFQLYDNCDSVGEIEPENCAHDGQCYDEDVVPLLEANLQTYQSGYRFIILHLGGGSHGPLYSKRHPPEFQVFKPQCEDADVVNQCTKEELYNSYDNTILYTDYVLGKITSTLETSRLPYVFIYLSDHGESLLEDGRVFHGMPPGISLPDEQAQVPLIVKSSIPISIVQRDEYLQPDVFDSVLDLLSIQTDVFEPDRAFIKKSPVPAGD